MFVLAFVKILLNKMEVFQLYVSLGLYINATNEICQPFNYIPDVETRCVEEISTNIQRYISTSRESHIEWYLTRALQALRFCETRYNEGVYSFF